MTPTGHYDHSAIRGNAEIGNAFRAYVLRSGKSRNDLLGEMKNRGLSVQMFHSTIHKVLKEGVNPGAKNRPIFEDYLKRMGAI